MDRNPTPDRTPDEPGNGLPDSITDQIRDAAYLAWCAHREGWLETPKALFDQAYLGHYAAVAAYVEQLVDDYELDAKLDAAIAEPFRPFVDVDVTALSRAMVKQGALYALSATPIGVWVFDGRIG